jgi:membrane-associated protease RseP (regulator of RpoE activity)
VFENLASLVALAAAAVAHVVASSCARWLAARAYGVRGAPLSFGFGKPWSLTGPRPRTAQIGIAAAGLATSYFVAVLLLTLGVLSSGRPVTDEASMRVTVAAGGPASLAGIQDGDRILAVNDAPIADWPSLKAAVASHAAEGIDVLVARGTERLHVRVVPNVSGKMQVAPPVSREDVGIGSAFLEGLRMPFAVLAGTARGLVRLVAGTEKAELSGPVGVVAASAKSGVGEVLKLLGALSAYVLPFIALYNFWAAPGVSRRRGTSAHASPARR